MRLIDADALKEVFQNEYEVSLAGEIYAKAVCDVIDEQPTIEPERKRGKWIPVHPLQSDDCGAYMCSKCKTGMWEIRPSVYHYCPNCGKPMESR